MSTLRPDTGGRAYWRSLDQLADTPDFRDFVGRRFPASMRQLIDGDGGIDRRKFLYLMGASLGLAGLSGCRRPESHILPYARKPESVVQGLPTFYATALPRPSGAVPVLVETHEGRPTKIEGNPKHPASLGSTDVHAQSAILDLYDPDRARVVRNGPDEKSWDDFFAFADPHFARLKSARGAGLHFLSGVENSPSLDLIRSRLAEAYPESKWHVHEACGETNARRGVELAVGRPAVVTNHFDKARVIVSLDADFLGTSEGDIRSLRDFSEARRPHGEHGEIARLYAIESDFTLTGGMADHRLRIAPSRVAGFALGLARAVLADAPESLAALKPALNTVATGDDPSRSTQEAWIKAVADDLRKQRGKGLIVAGLRQPPLVHSLAHAMNLALGNVGATVDYRESKRGEAGTIGELCEALRAGRVDTLVIVGGNPAYDAPVELDFAEALAKAGTSIRLSLHEDETSAFCTWNLPAAHSLESWGDARLPDGSVLAIQPMIEPLFGGRSPLEWLARLAGDKRSGQEIVREAFRPIAGKGDFETAWRTFLHDGFVAREAAPIEPKPNLAEIARAIAGFRPSAPPSAESLEISFRADSKLADGRFANNGWLQELPDPVTKLAWENAALVSPKTAESLGLTTGDVIALTVAGRSVEIPAMILPGQAEFTIGLALGYGRTRAGRVGTKVGVDVYPLRPGDASFVGGATLSKTGRTVTLCSTQDHFSMEGRDIVREELAGSDHHEPHHEVHEDIQERPAFDGEYQWGMVVDLNACVGCNACGVACQSENNIPIVGRDEVLRGREMHWIRNDRYFAGDPDDPGLVHQPVACVHCENAPCEVVCPVNATVHSDEGLNLQVYNRCVGTRYCSNNCPYKVRRFNWFDYNERPLVQLRLGPLAPKGMDETVQMQKNPDVSVRVRGVMEKCTYCVQRIERGKIGARVSAGDGPPAKLADGAVVSACAQACPAQAIVFGDTSDPNSKVSRLKADNRNYSLLGEINTKPRTTYLSRLKNPNQALVVALMPGGEA